MANNKAVAFLAREIGSSASEMLFKGALAAVEHSGQSLVVFRGGYIGKDPGAVIYDNINAEFLGAIDWASASQDASKHPVARQKRIPLVTLTQHIPPHPVVVNDSHSGIHALVEHLIRDHGKRRIAFFRGPEGHPLAQERFKAYQEVLSENGIAFEEWLVSPCGNWDRVRGNELLRLFIEERRLKPGEDFDAVVCVNDNLAIGTIIECQARGIRVPEDIAVTGCNDILDARVNMPPVSTVALPGDTQVARALDVLNAMLRKEHPQDSTRLPGQAILRQSCGCASQQVVAAASAVWYRCAGAWVWARAWSVCFARWVFTAQAVPAPPSWRHCKPRPRAPRHTPSCSNPSQRSWWRLSPRRPAGRAEAVLSARPWGMSSVVSKRTA
ncbi:LacI family DNA-binding transcriptional regulator [Candidatus Dactylopiibacterium carminicum]|uniref:LacI family DNA-binding transcriptional regulator n=1 Tax=Candidatus Dactylopiibacterium carminicum TaxID=857335 RepID=UPI00148214CA|nr:substrate-binding domain-containing protein [Candidatus Dactylopiibacterium carminicum]